MRIACPSCNAVYQVPEEQLGEGRVVRCVRCGTDWSPVVSVPADEDGPGRAAEPVTAGSGAAAPAESLPEPPPEAEPEAEIVPDPGAAVVTRRMAIDEDGLATVAVVAPVPAASVTPRRRGGPWLAIAWVVSLAVVIGAVVLLVVRRETVMQVWAPSVRAYAAIGLAARP